LFCLALREHPCVNQALQCTGKLALAQLGTHDAYSVLYRHAVPTAIRTKSPGSLERNGLESIEDEKVALPFELADQAP